MIEISKKLIFNMFENKYSMTNYINIVRYSNIKFNRACSNEIKFKAFPYVRVALEFTFGFVLFNYFL